jgi:hypothetical protein
MAPKNAGPVPMEVDQQAQEGGFHKACVCILLVLTAGCYAACAACNGLVKPGPATGKKVSGRAGAAVS